VPITFPFDQSGGPTDASSNRIDRVFARVDEYTGYIASLTFQFRGVDTATGSNYVEACGAGTTYTRTVTYNARDNTTLPEFESSFCGLRSPCEKTTNFLKMPLLPCWGEEVQVRGRACRRGGDGCVCVLVCLGVC
jgi:hypothetical protein